MNPLGALVRLVRRAWPVKAASHAPAAHAASAASGVIDDALGALRRGDASGAERSLRARLAVAPDDDDAQQLLAYTLSGSGRPQEAAELLRALVRRRPEEADAWFALAVACDGAGERDEAIQAYRTVLRLDGRLVAAAVNVSALLVAAGQPGEAEAFARQALAAEPGSTAAHYNLGNALLAMHRCAEAIACYDAALASDPGQGDCHFNLAVACLSVGEFRRGWTEYEWRFRRRTTPVPVRPSAAPRWEGEPLYGRTLLVWGEQGIGDQILFSSLLPGPLSRGASIVFECAPKLAPLFARSFPDIVIRSAGGAASDTTDDGIDCEVPLGNLARWFRTHVAAFPPRAAYLRADPDRVAYWRERLRAMGMRRTVGICWRSKDVSGRRADACTTIGQWGPIFGVSGIDFVCLQYDDCAAELAQARERFGVTVHRFDEVDMFDDLDETAALIAALDLVLSAPTTVSLLAAAVGTPTWQLASGDDWQAHGLSSNPWFPAMRRFYRAWDLPWDDLLAEVASTLAGWVDGAAHPESKAVVQTGAATRENILAIRARGDTQLAHGLALQLMDTPPADGRFLLLAGVCAAEAGDTGCAVDWLTRCEGLVGASPDIDTALAPVLRVRGDHRAAEARYRAALRHAPLRADLHAGLAEVLAALDRLPEAIESFREAIRLDPQAREVWLNLGTLYQRSQRLDEALESYRHVLLIAPDSAKAHFNIANILEEQERYDDAIASFRAAEDSDPQFVAAWVNHGVCAMNLGRVDEAITLLERAVALDPTCIPARFSLGVGHLIAGHLERGWAGYELRFDLGNPEVPAVRRPFTAPVWKGEDLTNRTILIWGEQGVGDQLFHAGLFAEVVDRSFHCVIECAHKLIPLFRRTFPEAEIVGATDPPHPSAVHGVDFQIAAGSLCPMLRPRLDSFASRGGYLRADPVRAEAWRARLRTFGPGLKVGFSWRSSNLSGNRGKACTTLDQWGPVFAVPGTHFVCLQYDECKAELDAARAAFGIELHRFDDLDYYNDLDEVAALMEALDLVITAPTTVSMQASALGRPTWQLSAGPDWQVMGTAGTPWFPSMRRFDRGLQDAWAPVIERVADCLRRHCETAGAVS